MQENLEHLQQVVVNFGPNTSHIWDRTIPQDHSFHNQFALTILNIFLPDIQGNIRKDSDVGASSLSTKKSAL